MYKYPVACPDLSGNEKKYVNEALDANEISSKGSFVGKFEKLFAEKHGAKYGVAVSSGTAALFLSLRALGIGEGDEVIVPDFTMVATAWAVSYTGAKPVFVDCDNDKNIDVFKLQEKITPRTKAIIPVHIYGRKCRMDVINEIARQFNLKVVEDSCEAHGVKLDSSIACFSLFANKIITAGEGGICITNDENLAFQLQHLRAMAFDRNHTFYHPKIGYNFRMTNLQAAVALAQTERLEEILTKRKQIEKWYNDRLNFPGVIPQGERNVLWMYDLMVFDREKLMESLGENGIETRMFFKPMTTQPMYKQSVSLDNKAVQFAKNGIYLPTYNSLTEEDVDFICSKIKEFYTKK